MPGEIQLWQATGANILGFCTFRPLEWGLSVHLLVSLSTTGFSLTFFLILASYLLYCCFSSVVNEQGIAEKRKQQKEL